MSKSSGPKVLLFDIETAPILGYVWSIWEQNVGLSQIHTDWYVLSWSAKWLGDPEGKIMYQDQRGAKNVEDDKKLLKGIWKLLDEADIVVTQNGKKFDSKKLNARFLINEMSPPSSYKHIDTKQIAGKHFAFTSNSLEYLSDKLCKKYKKLKHKKFPGFELWKECLAGNIEAWKEMERYNKHDVLTLEELYMRLRPWDNTVNFTVYDPLLNPCGCKGAATKHNGYAYGKTTTYHRYKCVGCGHETRGTKNLVTKEKRSTMKVGVVR